VRTGSRWTCPGFEVAEHPGARVLARPEAVPWVRSVLRGGQGLHAAAFSLIFIASVATLVFNANFLLQG